MTTGTGLLDIVTIFPEFFAALDVSLIGKARDAGSLRIGIHDLRDWTTDRHRTVDDAPAGGGAGMVMKPDVWGAALDDVLRPATVATDDAATDADATVTDASVAGPTPTLLIPTPGGQQFTQRLAEELAAEITAGGQVVIACGRYEGIDSRVGAHYAGAGAVTVREVSIGDYVLNGGESAALVMIEAIGRLLPGVIGNPDSLVEESHGAAGLLEYPVYTQPASWRGLEVPGVLRSGDHSRVAAWRRDQAVARTARVRPDLAARLPRQIRRGKPRDAHVLHDVAGRTFALATPPGFSAELAAEFARTELSVDHFRTWAKGRAYQLWVAEVAGSVVGYSLVVLGSGAADLNKFYVLPEHHGSGVAADLMDATLAGAAQAMPAGAAIFLGVNQENAKARRFYVRHGFTVTGKRAFDVAGHEMSDFIMERVIAAPAQ